MQFGDPIDTVDLHPGNAARVEGMPPPCGDVDCDGLLITGCAGPQCCPGRRTAAARHCHPNPGCVEFGIRHQVGNFEVERRTGPGLPAPQLALLVGSTGQKERPLIAIHQDVETRRCKGGGRRGHRRWGCNRRYRRGGCLGVGRVQLRAGRQQQSDRQSAQHPDDRPSPVFRFWFSSSPTGTDDVVNRCHPII